MRQTLYDKIWRDHVIDEAPDGTTLLYVDRHLVHEVDSPQAFAGLRQAGLPVRAPNKTLLVVDHNVPTSDRNEPNPDPESAAQIACFAENAALFGLEYYDERDPRQGICSLRPWQRPRPSPAGSSMCANGAEHALTARAVQRGVDGATPLGIAASSCSVER